MRHSNDSEKHQMLLAKCLPESRLLSAKALTGGVSAEVTLLDVAHADGSREKLLVRRHGERDLARNSQVAEHEYRLLNILKSTGIPATNPRFLDTSGEIFETPYVVLDFIEGHTNFTPVNLDDFLRQIAVMLVRIHQVDIKKYDLSFLLRQTAQNQQKLDLYRTQADVSAIVRQIFEAVAPFSPDDAQTAALLHGDLWCGNLLWRDETLVGVIDWENAAIGNPLSDLANTRLEIMWAFGMEAMQQFTGFYRALMPGLNYALLPVYDLMAALQPTENFAEWAAGWGEYGRDDVTGETLLAGHRAFVAQAIEKLAI